MTKDRNSIYSIDVLSSIPPSILLQQLDSINSTITNSLNIDDVIQSTNQIMDHPPGKYVEGLAAINKLKQLDKEDKRVVEILVKFAQHYYSTGSSFPARYQKCQQENNLNQLVVSFSIEVQGKIDHALSFDNMSFLQNFFIGKYLQWHFPIVDI